MQASSKKASKRKELIVIFSEARALRQSWKRLLLVCLMSSNEERLSSAHRAMPSLRQINPNLDYWLFSGLRVRVIAATLATSSSK